jgi:hypothetical protein
MKISILIHDKRMGGKSMGQLSLKIKIFLLIDDTRMRGNPWDNYLCSMFIDSWCH